jgi:hypothetical protein
MAKPMGKKHSQCVSIPEAFEALNKTLTMQSELEKREEIGAFLAGLGAFEIRKDEKKVHPLDLVDHYRVWIKSDGGSQFNYGIDLV